jgi:lipoyl(octanoyl) transferase
VSVKVNSTHAEETGPTAPELRPAPERVLAAQALARVYPWGVRNYGELLKLQETLRAERRADSIPDTWLAGEHPTVITQGVRGAAGDLVAPQCGYPVFQVDRGGQTTLHNPGQLVIYPIARTQPGMLAQARASKLLLLSVRDWLADVTGVLLEAPKGRPGLFAADRKVAAIGLSIHGCITMHGIAINCCNDLSPWQTIIPCGEPSTRPQTLSALLGRPLAPTDLLPTLPALLTHYWNYRQVTWLPQIDG